MPTITQAREVVTTMTTLPECYRMGERGKPYADFFALRHSTYLPMLCELARNGNARAVEGITAMPAVRAKRHRCWRNWPRADSLMSPGRCF